jgi:hypothetical protein
LYTFSDGWPKDKHQQNWNANDEGKCTDQIKNEPNIRGFQRLRMRP